MAAVHFATIPYVLHTAHKYKENYVFATKIKITVVVIFALVLKTMCMLCLNILKLSCTLFMSVVELFKFSCAKNYE